MYEQKTRPEFSSERVFLKISNQRFTRSHILLNPLGDLDGVRRGAFAEIVAHAPESEGIGGGQVFANTTDKDFVLVVAVERRRIRFARKIVHEDDARRGGEKFARLLDRNLTFRLDDDALGMAVRDGNARRQFRLGGANPPPPLAAPGPVNLALAMARYRRVPRRRPALSASSDRLSLTGLAKLVATQQATEAEVVDPALGRVPTPKRGATERRVVVPGPAAPHAV